VFDSKLTAVVECSDSYASQTYLRNKTTIQIHKTIAQAALVLQPAYLHKIQTSKGCSYNESINHTDEAPVDVDPSRI
jgi:hypothetical protein